jgi:hypothetical protein
MNNAEIKQEIINSLSAFKQEELLEIKELIKQKITNKIPKIEAEKRKELIRKLQGKYAYATTSSEDFAQQKQKEIDWEERNII